MYLLHPAGRSLDLLRRGRRFTTMCGHAPPRIVQLVANIHELDRRRIPIDVDERPEWPPGLDPAEKDALLLAVDAEVYVARRGDVVEEDRVLAGEALREGFRPVARFVRQVRTCVLRKAEPEAAGVVVGVAETYDAAPVV